MYNNNLRNEVKESNRYFLDEILQTTYAYRKQMDLKIEKQLISKKVELDAQLNSVFGQVIYNWKMKVRNCALKGKNFANLFFFNKLRNTFINSLFNLRSFKNQAILIYLKVFTNNYIYAFLSERIREKTIQQTLKPNFKAIDFVHQFILNAVISIFCHRGRSRLGSSVSLGYIIAQISPKVFILF